MKKSPHHSTSNHSTDRTRKAYRVDSSSSHGDGNISDSSTTAILSNGNKRHDPSGRHKKKIYAIGSGKRNQETSSTSRKKEEKPRTSNHPYSQIITPDQKAHEEKQRSSKRTEYPADPITLVRQDWSTGDTWAPWLREIEDLGKLAQDVGDIKKQGLTPWKANKELDELMKRKGHLLKKTNSSSEADVPENKRLCNLVDLKIVTMILMRSNHHNLTESKYTFYVKVT
ncbi:uncharacterized protein EAF02_005341 [Botrytis sinoallii]|uniref:uncharacterized protein n=1 Tax=Botrytis sinoallii TaxID=1463999 RepID=UPI0019006CED|nr:uncharacterized protein EAF02_005341 [Botrytis sinoallii]KAF7883421.1 hypothetical protein EAF02_005341 [Botrytis sinoallii]